jgi:hypothetical protein
MTAVGSGPDVKYSPRRRERRGALGELLAALTRALDGRGDISLIRGAFEESLRRVIPVRSIQLRERARGWMGQAEGVAGAESVQFDVPGGDSPSQGILEATFDRECGLGEWDFQILGVAAHVAGLVLEIERGQGRPHSRVSAMSKPRRDGAAPLIGSTPAMQLLRSKIERVAGTDFTILLEGPSGAW